MKDTKNFAFATKAVHAGQEPAPQNGAIMTPIYQTSTFVQESPGQYLGRFDYARSGNPTRTACEANIAALEGGKYGLCFSSGLAAIANVMHLLKSGDHILVSDDIYGGTFRLLDKVYSQLGLTYTMVDFSQEQLWQSALRKESKMLLIESPTNPMLKILDIKSLCTFAKSNNLISVVDNTFATPYLQNPLALGADIVVHSTTKYIGGHSDVVGGALIVNDPELEKRLYFTQNAIGSVPAALDCFLILRSTKTLHVRMQRHCENARKLAEFLEQHPKVEKVIYPGLSSHPQHQLAKTQMRDFGGMISIYLKSDLNGSKEFLKQTKLFSLAESLGGVESLIEHPAIMTHASLNKEARIALGIGDNFVRLSVGIEDVHDLQADLENALRLI